MPYVIPKTNPRTTRPSRNAAKANAAKANAAKSAPQQSVRSTAVPRNPSIQGAPRRQSTEFYSRSRNMVLYHTTKCAMTTMKNYLNCDRVPLSAIPADAKVICVVRHPVSRFISGFLTLRKINLMKCYEVRRVSDDLKHKIKHGPIIPAFEAALAEVQTRGAFDTHLQPQTAYLGPSNTIQNEFAGSRSPAKVTYWVPIQHLTKFCQKTFGSAPPRKNEANKGQENQLKNFVKNNPRIAQAIEKVYAQDLQRYEDVVKKFSV